MRRLAAVAGSLVTVVSMILMGVAGARVGASTSAPHGAASARYQGGAEVSDGVRTMTVSQTSELQPGQSVVVSGTGFDVNKGVYVGLCVVPPPGAAPSPCAGGEDRSGITGASAWFSSNPPPYATGIADPYAQGGSFSTQLSLTPGMADGLDCREVQCAIATRNDHTRSSDRSQDLFIPVTFAAGPPETEPPPPPPAAAQPTAPPPEPVQATIPDDPPPTAEQPAPTTEVAPTTKPKEKATTTTKPKKATTTNKKATTTSSAPERDDSEEATITVTSGGAGAGGGWGWALAAGGVVALGAAGAGVFRMRSGHWPGTATASGETGSAP